MAIARFARRPAVFTVLILIGCVTRTVVAEATGASDVAHPQLVREFFEKDTVAPLDSISAMAVGPDGQPWIVAKGRLFHRNANAWEQNKTPDEVFSIVTTTLPVAAGQRADTLVLAGGADGVWSVKGEHSDKEPGSPPHVDGFVSMANSAVGAIVNSGAGKGLWTGDGGWKKLCDIDPAAGHVKSICQLSSGIILAVSEKGVYRVVANQAWTPVAVTQNGLLSADVAQIAPLGFEHAMLMTSRGLSLTDGQGWQNVTGKDGLPIEMLKCASTSGGSTWFGSDQGTVLWRNGQFTYFAGPRWLPDDHITAIAAGPQEVWIATRAGLSRIFERPMTLKDKADHYQHVVEDRPRRLGFVTVMHLKSPGNFDQAEQEISDNDGLWTAMYVAAECFRYAENHEPAAREQARKSMQALLRLESITGISGFPARAISNIHDPANERRSGGQWHPSPVEKDWMWKGDTSSDEIVGHYLAFYLYSTLVADDQEKQQIKATCKRITDHILDHGYNLVDITGKPTTWGYWSPERLNGGRGGDRGLNSLEILSHLKVAYLLVGDERYKAAYQDLIEKHHYALNTIRQRVSFMGRANHSDDELAFLSYYPLLILETDPALRSIYQSSIRRTWDAVRPESCPLWNYIYGACSGESCDADLAAGALNNIPLDLIHWPTANARRADLKFDPSNDRFGRKQLLKPLKWTERPLHKWNNNPYELDGGGGTEEEDPTFWLLPYWMGRYHHLLN